MSKQSNMNNSSITDWIKYELYPVLFESIDRAFPEHNFKKTSGGWNSKTYLNATPHSSRLDKTVITKKAPGLIHEQGGETLSLIDYVMRRDGVEFITAVNTLSNVAGLDLPKAPDFDQETYIDYKKQATILEDCNSYFIFCLEKSPNANKILDYLKDKRGYTEEEIKQMEIGFIPSQEKLFKYLEGKKHDLKTIHEVVKLNSRIGEEYNLTIPYRSGGAVKGFKFRTLNPAITPKYLNNTGLDKLSGFFNLSGIKGNKDVTIVEGELDSLHATVKGIDNVVAAGGSSIDSNQIKDALRRGAKSFTLCFDYEPGKEEETNKKILAAIQVILSEGVDRIYIASLPGTGEAKIDPDSLIKDKGVEALKKVIEEADIYYKYLFQITATKYVEIQEKGGGLTSREIDSLLEEVMETAIEIKNPIDRDLYKKDFLDFAKPIGVTEESLSIALDRLTSTRDKEEQNKEFKKLLQEVTSLQSSGEVDKAIDLISEKTREVKLKNKATEFDKLLTTTSESEMKEEEAILPDSINSGYTIGKDEILLPGGQISVIAGATGHGKTITLINMALNALEKDPSKEFIFFTYEERASIILQYFLNAYINIDLNSAEKSNRRLIRDYFKKGSTEYFKTENISLFEEGKKNFFKKYIETGRLRIKSISFDSEELDLAIRYLYKERANLGGVFIDYFQLINLPGKTIRENRINSRQEELKRICQDLNNTAKDTGLPLVLAAQFNRTVKDILKVHSTNISEAGDIERIVNTLIGIWDISKKSAVEGKTENNEINMIKGGRETGMYMEILKSRDIATGGNEIFDYNGNTGRISTDFNLEEMEPF